jgi:hypothetical protein
MHGNRVVAARTGPVPHGQPAGLVEAALVRVSTAYAAEPNIVVTAAQNHCAIPVSAGFSTYRPVVLCSATRPSAPNRPAIRTPGLATSSSNSLISGLPPGARTVCSLPCEWAL